MCTHQVSQLVRAVSVLPLLMQVLLCCLGNAIEPPGKPEKPLPSPVSSERQEQVLGLVWPLIGCWLWALACCAIAGLTLSFWFRTCCCTSGLCRPQIGSVRGAGLPTLLMLQDAFSGPAQPLLPGPFLARVPLKPPWTDPTAAECSLALLGGWLLVCQLGPLSPGTGPCLP